MEYHQKALEIFIKVSGQDLVLEAMGKKSEAKKMFTDAAGIRRKVLGADHPLTKKSERLAAQ